MLIILATILPLKVSLTLSAILTAALFFVCFGQRVDFWIVAGVAIGMLWRGEFWKTAFLESEQQLSELRQQLKQPASSRAEFSRPDRPFQYVDLCSFGRGCPHVFGESRAPTTVDDVEYALGCVRRTQVVFREIQRRNLLAVGLKEPLAFLIRSRALSLGTALQCPSGYPQPDITADLVSKNHTNRHPNTLRFYMTYIV
jgi:hypothetical protein